MTLELEILEDRIMPSVLVVTPPPKQKKESGGGYVQTVTVSTSISSSASAEPNKPALVLVVLPEMKKQEVKSIGLVLPQAKPKSLDEEVIIWDEIVKPLTERGVAQLGRAHGSGP